MTVLSLIKKHSGCIFASFLACIIICGALGALAHNTVSQIGFFPSQIFSLTESGEENAEFSGRIEEELSELFGI